MTTAHPPTVHHASTPLSPSQTLTLLTAYLSGTHTDPSLHPSAHLTEHGPVAPSTGPNTGLVLHNLRRVEAGLRGENLGDDATFRKYGGDGLPGLVVGNGAADEEEARRGWRGEGEAGQGAEGEWQDKAEFERQQEVVQGDVGERDNGVDGGFEEEGGVVPRVKSTWDPGDTDARKKAKKERRKKTNKEKAAKKQREKDAEKS
ncbi:hypothetical protein IMSHALPRED_002617 [Imshaugia aleurites]|uniref:Uncharacterized protein n=1 Tax=Imshaugia aleurites TaxID=172621 RepID=A0A8H3EXQ5_9LECA|nr:hypothetical protein IMSHALPRED_002617 [Imshaugia aleurites]